MTRQALRVTLVGTSPLLMHSGSLLDPIDPVALELAQYHEKRDKSAADHAHIGDLEFAGSLWIDDDWPCVPARTLQAALREAADRRGLPRRTRQALGVEADARLCFEGPRTLDALKRDPSFRHRAPAVVAGTRRILTRPCFERWSVTPTLLYDSAEIGVGELVALVAFAGEEIGIGAGRPRHGRFSCRGTDVFVDGVGLPGRTAAVLGRL